MKINEEIIECLKKPTKQEWYLMEAYSHAL